jgi:hypothetical protein
LSKAESIRDLQYQYQDGIRQVQGQILIGKRNEDISSLQQALESKRIERQLYSIRRRKAFIKAFKTWSPGLTLAAKSCSFLKEN